MKTQLQSRFLALALLLAAPFAATAADDAAAPALFRPLDFAAASAAAKQEGRLLLVDFYTTWCGPCHLLDVTTWRDARVVELVGAKAVAVKIDAERQRDLAKRHQIDAYPTILVLAADGTERDRYVGYLKPEEFVAKFTATLAGKNSLAQAQEKVAARGGKDPKERLELGRALAKQGNAAEALEHFLWCFDEGVAVDPKFAKQRDERLPGYIAGLGKTLPAALDALRARREATARQIDAAPAKAKADDYKRLGTIDAALRDDAAMLAMVEKLRANPALLRAYGDPVQRRLIETKHYREAIAISPPEAEFADMDEKVAMMRESGRMAPEQLAGVLRKAATEGAVAVEALAGAGETERARKLARGILRWDDSVEVRAAFAKRLERAGATELAAEFSGRPVAAAGK